MKSLLVPAALAATAAYLVAAPRVQDPDRAWPEFASEEEREQAYFEIIDHDQRGWISFREARESLGLDRPEFYVYDTDRDGRISREEFKRRYQAIVDLTGAFQTPKPHGESRAITRSPAQILSAYDQDADRAIAIDELETLLSDYDREELDSSVVLEQLDRSDDHLIAGDELKQLSRLLAAPVLVGERVDPADRPADVLELFGQVEPRDDLVDAVPQPDRVPGPIPHFDRLDYDRDGFISIDDLRDLQSPVQLKARAGPVLATLDLDGDERVSREEFHRAMSDS
jgi:Ca2+-binding EF-hand superfamily protein